MQEQPQEELKRSLGLWSALSIVIGTIIGSGIFCQPPLTKVSGL
ncbi:hypothetical protein [Limosilactobacillus fermentum]|nr:hypothetical protein [Limosilactobacillus fermentum]